MTCYLNRIGYLSSWVILLLLVGLSLPVEAHNEKTAYAIPLEDITIDGMLDDWPEEMAVYPIEWVASVGGYKSTPPDGPEDLTAGFRLGYDLQANLLYLAVVLQDEDLVVHPEAPSGLNQDICEVYVDADHSGESSTVGAKRAQIYVMVPGPGQYSKTPWIDGNPALAHGNTQTSGVKAAFQRLGQTLVYEWSIPLFESFPEKQFQIEVGKTIGFDVVVDDADGQENGNWVAWTPGTEKYIDSDFLGDLAFVEDYEGLEVALEPVAPLDYSKVGIVTGQITERNRGTPMRNAKVEIIQEDKTALVVSTDSTGTYRQPILPGTYTVRALVRGVRDTVVLKEVEVVGGGETRVDLSLEDLGTLFYVDDDALNEGDGSAALPFQAIQQALNATSEGDTVQVAARGLPRGAGGTAQRGDPAGGRAGFYLPGWGGQTGRRAHRRRPGCGSGRFCHNKGERSGKVGDREISKTVRRHSGREFPPRPDSLWSNCGENGLPRALP